MIPNKKNFLASNICTEKKNQRAHSGTSSGLGSSGSKTLAVKRSTP